MLAVWKELGKHASQEEMKPSWCFLFRINNGDNWQSWPGPVSVNSCSREDILNHDSSGVWGKKDEVVFFEHVVLLFWNEVMLNLLVSKKIQKCLGTDLLLLLHQKFRIVYRLTRNMQARIVWWQTICQLEQLSIWRSNCWDAKLRNACWIFVKGTENVNDCSSFQKYFRKENKSRKENISKNYEEP